MKNDQLIWAAVIVAAVYFVTQSKPRVITHTRQGQPLGGSGINPFGVGQMTVEAVALAGGF